MRLQKIQLEGVRGLPSREWQFSRDRTRGDLVVVTGGPGSGKSTFIEALVAAKEKIAPYGIPDSRWGWLVPKDAKAAKVHLTWQATPEEVDRHRLGEPYLETEAILGEPAASLPPTTLAVKQWLGAWSPDPSVGRVIYLHQGRALPPPTIGDSRSAGDAYRLSSSDQKFAFVHGAFDDSAGSVCARASELLAALAPKLALSPRSQYRGQRVPWFAIPREKRIIPHAMLSAAEKQAVLISFALSNPLVNDSVVVIDSPEEAFGDIAAASLVRTLLRWGSRNQLILATGSTHVAELAAPGQIIQLGEERSP